LDSGVAQTLEAQGRKASFELGYPAEPGYIEVRSEVAKRIQNEVPLHYPRMREDQARLLPALPASNEEVEIDDTGPPALPLCGSAEGLLEREQLIQQPAGIELCKHSRNCVDEVRL
jgi:hypothetical protein